MADYLKYVALAQRQLEQKNIHVRSNLRARKASVDFELDLNYDEYPKCPVSDKKPLTLETPSHSPPNGLSRDSQDMEIDIVINSVELEILEGYI